MLNTIILIGKLGRDPEILRTQDGQHVAKFSLATSSIGQEDTSEESEKEVWHQIIVFREITVHYVRNLLKKGDLVCVEGKLTYKLQQDGQGRSYWIPYIVISENYGRIELLLPKKPLDYALSPEETTDNSVSNEYVSENLADGPQQIPHQITGENS